MSQFGVGSPTLWSALRSVWWKSWSLPAILSTVSCSYEQVPSLFTFTLIRNSSVRKA